MTNSYSPKGWRPKWFVESKRYRVIDDIKKAIRVGSASTFIVGETLEFGGDSYSIYDCSTRYVFSPVDGDKSYPRSISLHDDDALPDWSKFFTPTQ
jgi:hypothetical protein